MTRKTKIWVIALVIFLVLAAVTWMLPTWLALKGKDIWVLRIALWALEAITTGAVVWFLLRKSTAGQPGVDSSVAKGNEDIDTTMSAAKTQLAAAKLADKATIGTMPMVILMGPEGSAKTTSVVRSGLEVELLAGEVARGGDTAVAPTRGVNVWYAQSATFLEAGGATVADAGRWARVIHHAQPARLGAALAGGTQSPRVAVVCFSCEELVKPGNAQAVPQAAAALRQRLIEASQQLGIRLPVYVIFTKMDRLPYFADYVQTLSREESQEVLGSTLPVDLSAPAGSYADRESQRVGGAMHGLFESLAEKRLVFLARENAPERKPGSYEFPREFRKVAPLATQFLVDLCKPSQLQVSPFLRGFYFTGVQAVYVTDVAPGAAQQPAASTSRAAAAVGATGVFSALQASQAAVVAAPVAPATRKVPRWDFIPRVFRDVILADKTAMGVTTGGQKVNTLRRVALAAVSALAAIIALGWTVSFFGNRNLEKSTMAALGAVRAVPASTADLPTKDALARLDSLRERVAVLHGYEFHDSLPMRLTWGLSQTHALWPEAQKAYFAEFRRLMFGDAHAALVSALGHLPDTPADTDSYEAHYNDLKAYLITTQKPESSTVAFLPPVLLARWIGARTLDPARDSLVRRQLTFYAEELRDGHNPYSLTAETPLITHARTYLSNFKGFDRIYQNLLTEAGKGVPGVQYNREYPPSVPYVTDAYEVPGAFTKDGWTKTKDLLKNADRVLKGETWVLGEQTNAASVDKASLVRDLRTRYTADYAKHWRAYLVNARFQGYSNVQDAATKLGVLSGAASPILQVFALASRHIQGDVDSSVTKAFSAVQAVVPPAVATAGKVVDEKNKAYVDALQGLKVSLDQFNATAGNPAGRAPAAQASQQQAIQAQGSVNTLASGFVPDAAGNYKVVQELLLKPITSVLPYVKDPTGGIIASEGGGACSALSTVSGKFPFNPSSSVDATIEEVNGIFRPTTGSLWQWYNGSLQQALAKQGSDYVPTGKVQLTPAFVSAFNRAAKFSEALYSAGPDPRLSFTLRPVISENVSAVNLTLDGQQWRFTKGNEQPHPFIWSGAAPTHGALMGGQFGGGGDLNFQKWDGTWAIFRLFYAADTWRTSGAAHTLEWLVRTGNQVATAADGSPLKVVLELNMGALPPLLKKGELMGLRCGTIAQQ